MTGIDQDVERYFVMASEYCHEHGYSEEIQYVRDRPFGQIDDLEFAIESAFVIINSGMKNQVAQKIYERYCKEGPKAVRHEGKRKAIEFIEKNRKTLFAEIQKTNGKVNLLEDLPWIGKITKYHLARNLGLDCVKPDRHLVRLAEKYQFANPDLMCKYLAGIFNERLGTIDVILWRYCNLTRNYDVPDEVLPNG